MTVLVSVLMATYNSPKYLAEAIRSIQRQTLQDFELIIIDESTDGVTRDILAEFSSQDSRIIVRHEKKLGLNKSLNLAIKIARGKFLARMDGDDISLPDRFRRQIAYLNEHPEIGVVGTWAKVIDEHGAIVGEVRTPVTPQECKRTIIRAAPFVHPSIMARKEVMQQYHENYRRAEDYELWARMIRTTNFANIPEFLFSYRQDFKTNVSITKGKETEWNSLKVRASLLSKGVVPAWQAVDCIRPVVMFLVPMRVKTFIIKQMRKK